MQPSTIKQSQQQLTCPQLPLGVYREVAAHLRQVTGIDASLVMRPIEHDPTEEFDYYQSQVAALKINYSEVATPKDRQRVQKILDYYARRYQAWESQLG